MCQADATRLWLQDPGLVTGPPWASVSSSAKWDEVAERRQFLRAAWLLASRSGTEPAL